jgi:homopolymeric O-antigen transport system permease protein
LLHATFDKSYKHRRTVGTGLSTQCGYPGLESRPRYLCRPMASLSDFAGTRELTLNLTLRELRSRYKRTVLGWTWSLLNPLSALAIYWVVFGYFLKIQPPVGVPSGLHSFALFLLCGLIPWNFFSNGLNAGLGSLVGNGNLIKKVYFPRELLVVSSIASVAVTMLIELGVLAAILLLVGNFVLPWIPVVVVLVAIQAVFVLGIALVLAVGNVYFRDMQHLIAIALQVLFYATPIVYPISYVPDTATILGVQLPLGDLSRLNPLVVFVGAFRDVMYDLRWPPLLDFAYLILWAVALFGLGMWVFARLDRRLAEEV